MSDSISKDFIYYTRNGVSEYSDKEDPLHRIENDGTIFMLTRVTTFTFPFITSFTRGEKDSTVYTVLFILLLYCLLFCFLPYVCVCVCVLLFLI